MPRGAQRVVVTYDIDVNGTFDRSAQDKSTDKSKTVHHRERERTYIATEFECMVQEAKKYRDEDEANKAKIKAKNGWEITVLSLRNTLTEDKLNVHDVVLVGGSTRIPMVQKMIQELCNGKESF